MENVIITKHGRRRFRRRAGHSAVEKVISKALKHGDILQKTHTELKVLFHSFLFIFAKQPSTDTLILVTVEKEAESRWYCYSKGKSEKLFSKKRFCVSL